MQQFDKIIKKESFTNNPHYLKLLPYPQNDQPPKIQELNEQNSINSHHENNSNNQPRSVSSRSGKGSIRSSNSSTRSGRTHNSHSGKKMRHSGKNEKNMQPELLLKSVEQRVENQSKGLKSLASKISEKLPSTNIQQANIPPRGVVIDQTEPELNMNFSGNQPAENDISFEATGQASQMKRTTTGKFCEKIKQSFQSIAI